MKPVASESIEKLATKLILLALVEKSSAIKRNRFPQKPTVLHCLFFAFTLEIHTDPQKRSTQQLQGQIDKNYMIPTVFLLNFLGSCISSPKK